MNSIRNWLASIIEEDGRIIKNLQDGWKSPLNDFIMVKVMSVLGTHTAFLIGLPFLFWLGDPVFARHVTLILAQGVIATNLVKDFFCLPRPSSPPVERRLHEPGSTHPFEYGFPSTHSCNAASFATYIASFYGQSVWDYLSSTVPALVAEQRPWELVAVSVLIFAFSLYAFGLPLSRNYCGMHSFPDVIFGTILGGFLTVLHVNIFGPLLDYAIDNPDSVAALLNITTSQVPAVIGGIALLVYIFQVFILHPDPDGACPCYDDSICQAGVGAGLIYGVLDLKMSGLVLTVDAGELFINVAVRRVVVGTLCLMLWRAVVKAVGWKYLPSVFQQLGLSIMSGLKTSHALKEERKLKKELKQETRYESQISAYKTEPIDSTGGQSYDSTVLVASDVEEEDIISRNQDKLIEKLTTILESRESLDKSFVMERYSLEMLLKMFIYTGIGYGAVNALPRIFIKYDL